MIPDLNRLQFWISRCEADEPLAPGDERYVSLETLRGEDHILPIFDCIVLKRDESCQLFSGYNGTGKSTELRRLKSLLEDRGHVVLLADTRDYHDLYHQLTIEDLLVMIAGALGEAVSRELGEDVTRAGYWDRFTEFLLTEIKMEEARIPVVDLKMSLQHGKPFWRKVRDRLVDAPGKLRVHTHAFVRHSVERLRRSRNQAKVVFLLDSLERLRGPETEFRETMESVLRIFTQHASDLKLPGCHVVYTVPPYLEVLGAEIASRYDRPLHVLPSVKVLERGPELAPYGPGVQKLVELVAKRVPVEQIFGDRRDLLEKLVLNSAGHLRTLVALLRELLIRSMRGGLPPAEDHVDRVLSAFREGAHLTVRAEGARILAPILRTGRLEQVAREDLPLLAHFMDTQIVLCYRNGEGWFEVHPLVREQVRRLAAPSGEPTED